MINESMTSRNFTSKQDEPSNELDQPLVLVVDDDKSVREAVEELMLSAGMKCACFASTQELLQTDMLKHPGCLVLDVRMPGSSGLDLQRHLAATGIPKPIVFLTGYGDIPMTVDAMKAGAIDFLTKPVRGQALLDAVTAGINRDATDRAKAIAITRNVERLGKLTPRERQIIREVACGRLNKQIAFDLGISEVTVKLHRSHAMQKLEASSIGELVRIWESLPVSTREAGAT